MKASWVCLFLFSILIPTLAAEYEVDGKIEQTIYNRDGSVAILQKSQFTVFVRDCAWLIRTTQNDTNGRPVTARETACVNGAEIYEVAGRSDAGNTRAGRGSPSANLATVVSNNVPVGRNNGYFVSHLWMMFASGCYFASLTNDLITPVYDVNASVDVNPNYKLKAKWGLTDGPGSLPLNVIFTNDIVGSPIIATYTATGVTNAGAINIPSGFVFEHRINFTAGFLPGPFLPGKKYPEYGIRKRAVATVTAVRPHCSRSDLTPTAKGKTMVLDQRPLQEPGSKASPTNLTYYVVQDGVQRLPYAKAKKDYVVRKTPPKPVSRGIIFVVLFLPTALFLSYLLLNRKKG